MNHSVKQSQQLNVFSQGLPAILFFHASSPEENLIQDDAAIMKMAKKMAGKGFISLSMENNLNTVNESSMAQQQLAMYKVIQDAQGIIKSVKNRKGGL